MSSGLLDAASVQDAQPEVPRVGLSLAALRAFADRHDGRSYALKPRYGNGTSSSSVILPFKELTTAQVAEAIVKPATANGAADGTACTYAELLLTQVCGPGNKKAGNMRGCADDNAVRACPTLAAGLS